MAFDLENPIILAFCLKRADGRLLVLAHVAVHKRLVEEIPHNNVVIDMHVVVVIEGREADEVLKRLAVRGISMLQRDSEAVGVVKERHA